MQLVWEDRSDVNFPVALGCPPGTDPRRAIPSHFQGVPSAPRVVPGGGRVGQPGKVREGADLGQRATTPSSFPGRKPAQDFPRMTHICSARDTFP